MRATISSHLLGSSIRIPAAVARCSPTTKNQLGQGFFLTTQSQSNADVERDSGQPTNMLAHTQAQTFRRPATMLSNSGAASPIGRTGDLERAHSSCPRSSCRAPLRKTIGGNSRKCDWKIGVPMKVRSGRKSFSKWQVRSHRTVAFASTCLANLSRIACQPWRWISGLFSDSGSNVSLTRIPSPAWVN